MADGLLSDIFGAIDRAKRGVSTRYNMLMDNPQEYLAQIEERARESNRVQQAGMPGFLAQYTGAPVTPEQQRATQYANQQMQDVAMGFTGNVKPTGLLGKVEQQLPAVPQTMYHGTASDIQAFRPGNTVYVTPSPKFAESYAGTQSPNIMPLQANVTKPFNYESAADIQKLAETYKKIHGEDLFAKKTISSAGGEMKLSQLDKNPISQRLKSGDWTLIEDKKVQDAIKKAGFDAFYIEEGGVKNLGVYDPTKLKSVFSPSVNPPGLLGAKESDVLYHGTTPQAAKAIEKSGFDINKSADGTIWFTSNPNIGEVAASGKGGVVKRILDKSKVKLGGWEEADKYSTNELMNMGYDGLALKDKSGITYQIFNPEKLKK